MSGMTPVRVGLLFALLLVCCRESARKTDTPCILAGPVEFGLRRAGSLVNLEVPIQNVGNSPVIIGPFKTPCTCTVVKGHDKVTVGPGQTYRVGADVDLSKAQSGSFKTAVYIATSCSPNMIEAPISGTVAPAMPDRLAFGDVKAGTQLSAKIALPPLPDRQVGVSLKSYDASVLSCGLEPAEPPNSAPILTVRLQPGTSPGPQSTEVVLATNDSTEPEHRIRVTYTVLPRISVAPKRLALGGDTTRVLPPKTIRVYSDYGDTVRVEQMAVELPTPSSIRAELAPQDREPERRIALDVMESDRHIGRIERGKLKISGLAGDSPFEVEVELVVMTGI